MRRHPIARHEYLDDTPLSVSLGSAFLGVAMVPSLAPPTPMTTRPQTRQTQPARSPAAMGTPCCVAALSLLLLSQPAAVAATDATGVEFTGSARVVDGDTLVLTNSVGAAHRVRLYGIDAPESKQSCTLPDGTPWACGLRAADALRGRIGNASVHCVNVDVDRYGRDVAVCDAGADRPLNSWLVQHGWALAYRQYGGAQYDTQEAQAKAQHAGVWQGQLQPPWQWRAQQRKLAAG